MKKQKADLLLRALLVIMILAMVIPPQTPVYAATTLTVTPLTWNVIGLDSNNVAVGPNHFPIGARVCNTGGEDATTVMATLVWDTNPTGPAQNPYIHIRPGTDDNLTVASLDAGACTDYYFEVEVDRNAAAYNTIQRYHIAVTASNATGVSTPTPRELFVEHLISQSRNSVTQVEYGTSLASLATVANGGTMTLIKGQTYYIKLTGATATNGYEQIESFINFPNTIFQTLSVETTYTVESSGNMASPYISEYGDGCVWENDPNSPNYRSCLNTGKAGGGITVTYQVKILSVPSAPLANPEPLSTLVYDFSGSSYHYNSDFSASTRYAAIVDPTTAAITKSFTPSTITSGGVSRMKITISNPNAGAVSGYNFVDPLPSGMQVATPSNASNTCATTFSPAADATSLSFSGGTVAANGSCTVQVDVTTISGSGTYTNTTNNLYVDSLDTGKYATAILKVTDAPTPPTPTCGVELASWNMGTGPGTPPPTYSFKSSAVSTATAAYAGTGTSSIDTAVGNPVNAWKVLAGWAAGPSGYPNSGAAPYYEFSVDTSKFTDVTFAFDFYLDGNWANSSNNVLYVYSQANGEPNFSNTFAMGNPRKSTWYSVPAISANSTGSSITTFRINVVGQQQDTAYADIDNVYIKGCRIPDPSTITKSFSPNPVAVGSTSTLVFSVANPNLGPSATLTGIDFNDFLPTTNLQGTVVVNNGSNTVTGTGTAFKSQLVVGSNLIIPSTPVNLTGTVAVTNGSYYVTGSGFTSEVPAGSRIVINSVGYVVSEVLSDTSLVLPAVTGDTRFHQSPAIRPWS
jgi:hypothetical protein